MLNEYEEIDAADNMDSQPQKSPGSEEGIIKNWIIVGMNLISSHIETNRDSFLHLLPTVSVQYWKIYLDRQLSEDYCRRTSMKSCMCDTHGFTIWAHLLIWKKCSTTLWKYFFSILLACCGDLLIYLSGFLKHLRQKDTALNYLRETGLKLKFQNWRFIQ